jgi:hypothetical protein
MVVTWFGNYHNEEDVLKGGHLFDPVGRHQQFRGI